jgi:hypothetical protein
LALPVGALLLGQMHRLLPKHYYFAQYHYKFGKYHVA